MFLIFNQNDIEILHYISDLIYFYKHICDSKIEFMKVEIVRYEIKHITQDVDCKVHL